MVNGVEDSGIGLDEAASDHLYRSRHADTRLVVAVYIGAHRQFGLFLGRVEQVANGVGIYHGIARPARGAGDGTRFDTVPFHTHERLRGSADQLLISELDAEFVRAGTQLLNPLE